MRKPRVGFVLAFPFVAAALVAGACSSSSSTGGDLFDGGPDVTADQSAADTGSAQDTSAKDTNAADVPTFFDSGPPHDAQAACAVVASDAGDADIDGEGGAVMTGNFETEPNDDVGNASTLVLNGPECGFVSPGTDVDFYKFTLPANATKWTISFDGNISLMFTVGTDAPVTLTPQSSPSPAFHAGAEYTIEVHSFDGQPQAYSITIVES